MQCPYCNSRLDILPKNHTCPHCTGPLDERWCRDFDREQANKAKPSWSDRVNTTPAPPVPPPQPRVITPPGQPGISCCPRCMSNRITAKKRGFSWGLGCLGFFLLPLFGLLLGCIGSKKLRYTCSACGHTWRR